MANLWKDPEFVKKADAVKRKAWTNFLNHFPKADKSRFISQESIDEKNNATAEVFFKESEGSFQSVFGSDRKYWSVEMKEALGLEDSGGFPYQLSPLGSKVSLPIPAVPFDGKAPSLKKIFNAEIKIYVTPDQHFTTKFREIFQEPKLRHTSAAEAKHWLGGPDMKYWPQQLNFAVFSATQGCGVSREIFDNGMNLPPQIRAFYKFHVYFTVRRILYQLGGIQSMSALPGDPTFSQMNNHYDVASYKKLCNEFGIDPSSDFRYTCGENHGLGSIYVYASGTTKTDYKYPGWNKFSDEGGKAIKGDLIYYIELGAASDTQSDWFAPNTASGLTQVGLLRINQSIEAFVYCTLGTQVNVRSSILGSGGRAKEAQSEFLVLMESAITQPDLAASVQRYQLSVDQAKVRLNLAVAPMAWLMPAQMIINTASTVGYNNNLKQALSGMKLGVNEVSPDTKKAGLKLIAGGPSKINPPNSHPSNPIHKAATAESRKSASSETQQAQPTAQKIEPTAPDKTPQHEINKTAVIIFVVGLSALLFMAWR